MSCTKLITPDKKLIDAKIVKNNDDKVWSLYFHGSKSKEGFGVGVGFLLLDPKMFIACRLEFNCTNNIANYEALIQGLKKTIDINIKTLVVSKKTWRRVFIMSHSLKHVCND